MGGVISTTNGKEVRQEGVKRGDWEAFLESGSHVSSRGFVCGLEER